PLPQKIKKLAAIGVERLFVMSFNKDFASLLPIDFIKNYIIGMGTIHVVVGFDFTFGFKAAGDTKLLQQESNKGDFGLTVISEKKYSNKKISSTEIRNLIINGMFHMVPYFLGTNYQIDVEMVRKKNARTLQIKISNIYILPKPGLYDVEIWNGKKRIKGKFIRHVNEEENDEIIVSQLISSLNTSLSITFLNEISVSNNDYTMI